MRELDSKADLLALGAVIALVLLSFSDVLFFGKSFYIRDLARIYYPERKVFREIVLGGEFPFWNPRYAAGQPLAANPTAEVFYPPQWLSLLPDFQFAVNLEIVLHFLIGAAGMFLLLRAMALSRSASAFGAFAFAFSGLLLSLSSLLPCLFGIVWMPWVGWSVERWLDRRRLSDLALAAFFLGIILLIAEPSTILQSGALMAAYLLYRMRSFRAISIAAALSLAAVLVGGGQIIPALDHQRDSGRAAGLPYGEVTTQSMMAARPLELIQPTLFGRFSSDAVYFWASEVPWLFSWYAGLLTAVLIIAAFIHRERGWSFVGGVTILSYLIALGKNGPVFPILYRLGLRLIRYPEKWFMPASFVLIVFAAIGADRFLREARFRKTAHIVSLTLVAFAAAALAFAWSPLFARTWHLSGYVEDILREARHGALTTLGTAIALALILFFRERPAVVMPLLALFLITDLGGRTYGLAPRIDRHFYDAPPIARTLPPGARIYNDADWRLALLPQPHVAANDRWIRMRNAMRPEMQSLWGFDSVLELDVTETMLTPTRELSRLFWRSQLSGQSDMVQRILAAAGATHVIQLRDATSPTDPVTVVQLPASRRWRFEGRGRILSARQTANTMDFEVEAAANALLVVSVTRHRYWRATVDGLPASIQPADVAFQAIAVPAGWHRVAMRYRNPLVVIFGFVSLCSAVTLLATYFVAEHRSRGGHIE